MLACGAMQYANRMGIPPVEALNYYTRAVSGLRKKLDAGEIDGSEDWLLVITLLLHCFEVRVIHAFLLAIFNLECADS